MNLSETITMSESKSFSLSDYVAKDIEKYKGVAVPVDSSFFQRAFIKNADPQKLHANPDDEFCDPKIGPNQEIISKYERDIRNAQMHSIPDPFDEPLMVTRIYPDGYMLLNGHHRWAAALIYQLKKVPIKIINVTKEADILKMINEAKGNRRVTLDLDEVVFASPNDTHVEKPMHFHFSKIYKERLKLGIPALFYFLNTYNYDIWVYSSEYYDLQYVRMMFKHYHVQLTGIVTGVGRKGFVDDINRKKMKELVEGHYQRTIHIDNKSVMCVDNETKDFQEFELSGSPETWSKEIIDIIKGLDKNESKTI